MSDKNDCMACIGFDKAHTCNNFPSHEELLKERQNAINERCTNCDELKAKLARVEGWLNNNTTHYLTSESEAPVLAGVCERIWYHATDDTDSYPFTDVIYKALEKGDE